MMLFEKNIKDQKILDKKILKHVDYFKTLLAVNILLYFFYCLFVLFPMNEYDLIFVLTYYPIVIVLFYLFAFVIMYFNVNANIYRFLGNNINTIYYKKANKYTIREIVEVIFLILLYFLLMFMNSAFIPYPFNTDNGKLTFYGFMATFIIVICTLRNTYDLLFVIKLRLEKNNLAIL